MPKIVVQVEWDVMPLDAMWQNAEQVALDIQVALARQYVSSAFTVTDVGDLMETLKGMLAKDNITDSPRYLYQLDNKDPATPWICQYCDCADDEHENWCPVLDAQAALAALEVAE